MLISPIGVNRIWCSRRTHSNQTCWPCPNILNRNTYYHLKSFYGIIMLRFLCRSTMDFVRIVVDFPHANWFHVLSWQFNLLFMHSDSLLTQLVSCNYSKSYLISYQFIIYMNHRPSIQLWTFYLYLFSADNLGRWSYFRQMLFMFVHAVFFRVLYPSLL